MRKIVLIKRYINESMLLEDLSTLAVTNEAEVSV